ncbi:ABC transporter substrate-binding protein [Olivibacter sp. SDN3]|uniref:ABC transporter substrate-binding protein n=1 Tax=Olivibacter sp. SDN3 TaxID=2764720 RepID=UPI0016510CB3|nr:ABC transporter substrate-binding protein [Olivibacter sp. SDN3]QNL48512.1 ABC transporter substrate-binding protein [Olivibacter sp. SDN3]
MKYNRFLLLLLSGIGLLSCKGPKNADAPTVGFIEAFEDATIADARKGFIEALAERGYRENEGTIEILYKNAQGDMGAMNQIVSFMQAKKVVGIGTSTTLATLAATQRIKEIPIFMCVTAMPNILGLEDSKGNHPENLFGVGENLQYIDTSFMIIKNTVKPKNSKPLRIGMIYNQAEPQSVDAFNRLKTLANEQQIVLEALPLNNSADAQLVINALLNKKIDAFFANPDNTVFSAFETIVKNCNNRDVPIFTSELGLVKRGAVAAYGADIYEWGKQAGLAMADFLDKKDTRGFSVELVKVRKHVVNTAVAERYKFVFPTNFLPVD